MIRGLAAAAAVPLLPAAATGAAVRSFRLVAAPAEAAIVGREGPRTPVWAYEGRVPGPTLRVRQGERLRIEFENRLPEDTSVHWHGIRVPNAMDGVPHVTQAPVPPGGRFLYEFDAVDAGTFWYHPHWRSHEQVERGLAGVLVVEEREPPAVDRELVWALDDWRLGPDARIVEDFAQAHDRFHAGRIGNTATINGVVPDAIAVAQGERLRLRLANVANARVFGLDFSPLKPTLLALDGNGVEPAPIERIVLGPGERADLVLDVTAEAGARIVVADRFYPRQAYELVTLAVGAGGAAQRDAPARLPRNPVAEPDLVGAQRVGIDLGGGAMDPKLRRGEVSREAVIERAREGAFWTVNGRAAVGHDHTPLFEIERGRTVVLAMRNDTAFHHPMHLHGHAFRVLSAPGKPLRDTVLLAPGEAVEAAFVADNPGDWVFHCHVLEHQAAGMTGLVRVG